VKNYLRGGRGSDLGDQGGRSTAGSGGEDGSDGSRLCAEREEREGMKKRVTVQVFNQSHQSDWCDLVALSAVAPLVDTHQKESGPTVTSSVVTTQRDSHLRGAMSPVSTHYPALLC
jgi:hypothetical protein